VILIIDTYFNAILITLVRLKALAGGERLTYDPRDTYDGTPYPYGIDPVILDID